NSARSTMLTIGGKAFSVTQTGLTTPLSCTATVPSAPRVALEGRTETMGELDLNCSGLTSALTVDVLLSLNTTITNNVSSGFPLLTGTAQTTGQLLGYSTVYWSAVPVTPQSNGT